jgi:hypothetical protein
MALWIRVEGETVSSTSITPRNGKAFTLEELQHMVGGVIEALPLNDGTVMWLAEEGKLNDLPYNPVADLIAAQHSGMAWSDYIVGDVVIATPAESGEDEEEED